VYLADEPLLFVLSREKQRRTPRPACRLRDIGSNPTSTVLVVSVFSVVLLALFGTALTILGWDSHHLRLGDRNRRKDDMAAALLYGAH
jgi:hypothetical protein